MHVFVSNAKLPLQLTALDLVQLAPPQQCLSLCDKSK